LTIDLPTLMLAGAFVAAVSGVFLVFAWLQNRKAMATLWWAASNLVLAVSIPMMAALTRSAGWLVTVVAVTLLNVSPALIWASARACNGRRIDAMLVASGALLWLLADVFTAMGRSIDGVLALNLTVVSVFLLAAAFEFWRDRHERLNARWPLIVLLTLHGGLTSIAAVISATFGLAANAHAAMIVWLQLVHFETLAFIVGTSIFTVAMARERSELQHRIAANTDALTGVATRRAFHDIAEALLIRSRQTGGPIAAVAFDLDRFKAINDTFGHALGDRVLATFGAVALRTLRGTDLIGRLGGEEFAVVLPESDVAAAMLAAERIRLGFGEACRTLDGHAVNATVSAGVAFGPRTVDALLTTADAALYEAKRLGRNRVEIADGAPAGAPADAGVNWRVA
jgi:diguanylate cyclase (GGDEF)-like protein